MGVADASAAVGVDGRAQTQQSLSRGFITGIQDTFRTLSPGFAPVSQRARGVTDGRCGAVRTMPPCHFGDP
jgi:hypothetical protein